MSGLKLAASFSIIPNRLGFCGPQISKEQKVLREFLRTDKKSTEARKVLKKFEGAFSYYQLIAQKNRIKDPFDKKVVEAYWIGNKLLDKISTKDVKRMVLSRFTVPGLLSREEALKRVKRIPDSARPHHSFHVFILGPVTGRVDLGNLKLKDICRVGWGRIKKISNFQFPISKITVGYKPIVKGYKFGRVQRKEIDWDKDIVPEIKAGDWVAFHWNTVTKILSQKEIKNLKKYTQFTLSSL